MPALPEIVGQFIEPADTGGHEREDRQAAKDFHGEELSDREDADMPGERR